MKHSFAIGIPTINRADLLNPTLQKYFQDFPNVDIYILDNGSQKIISRKNNFYIHKPSENYGVARSWNHLCSEIFKNHDYALILNDDIYLGVNEELIDDFAKGMCETLVKCQNEFHFSSFLISKKCFEKHQFDENFYPAYFEDKDYLYRLKLDNLSYEEHNFLNPYTFINSASISPNGGNPSINNRFSEVFLYYMKKWGGPPGQEIFNSPFNKNSNKDKIIEIISVTYNHGYKLKCFIDSIRSQSCDNWRLNIIHDGKGKLFDETKKDLKKNGYLDNPNISFRATEIRHNDYGHSLRDFGIKNPISKSDYTVITNCDNYYVPEWISILNNYTQKEHDFITWDCAHNHIGNIAFDRLHPYGLCSAKLKEGSIDMGSVAIKTDIVSQVGFNHSNFNGDWNYFVDCLKLCNKDKIFKIPCILFVHN